MSGVLAQIGYGYRLDDDAMGAVAEGVTDRKLVGMESIRAGEPSTRVRRSCTKWSVFAPSRLPMR